MKTAIPLIILALLLCGCSRKTAPPVTRQQTTLQTDSITSLITRLLETTTRDSEKETVYIHTTRTVTLGADGDTTRTDTQTTTEKNTATATTQTFREREHAQTDRVQARTDSINTQTPALNPQPARRPWHDTILIRLGQLTLTAAAIFLAIYFIRHHN